ncbi:MAG: hemolysin family protein [Planctomycetota bacterium]|nr:hemolysin family protein [Planctomycetota bacterium]
MSHVWLGSGIVAAGLAMFFALAGHALSRFSRARLEEALERRGRAEELGRLFAHHDDLVRTTALLHVLALVAWTATAILWASAEFGTPLGWLVGVILAAAGAVSLGGVLPMAWARYAPESVLAATLPALHACRLAFQPAARLLGILDGLVRRLAGVPGGPGAPGSPIEEEIRSVVREGEREGALHEDQKDMIESVIRFRKADVTETMTPRTDIVSIDADATPDEARRLIVLSGHSRIPVTGGAIDTIVGILYAKDLLSDEAAGRTTAPVRVADVMRPPLFIPATKRLDELLAEFRRAKVHMAVVLDEYGGTAGLVTIEDLIEEIFGEIADEYEEPAPVPIRRLDPRTWEVEARAHIDELNDELSLNLPENEDYETIGGFVLSRLGYIPKAGEVLEHQGLRITVLEAEDRRITRLRIERAPAAPLRGII